MFENAGNYACSYNASFTNPTISGCEKFYNDFVATFNVVKACNGNNLGNCIPTGGILNQDGTEVHSGCGGYYTSAQNSTKSYIFNDGTYIFTYLSGSGPNFPLFAVDVNGHKKPNQWGKDVFSFGFAGNQLKPDTCGSSYAGHDILMGK